MNAQGSTTTFTLPVRTYLLTTFGKTCVSNSRQIGHWRSMNSTIVTGAVLEPSVVPCCGMPLNSAATSEAPGRAFRRLPTATAFFGNPLEPFPPESTSATTTATTISAATAAPTARTRGDAWRGAAAPGGCVGRGTLVFPGGLAGAARRRCLLALPLGIRVHASPGGRAVGACES